MEHFIPLVTRQRSLKVCTDDVVYIQRENRKIKIKTECEIYVYYEKMENVRNALDERFYACLDSLIINLDKVQRMEEQMVYFSNGDTLQLARNCFIRTKQVYAGYLHDLY